MLTHLEINDSALATLQYSVVLRFVLIGCLHIRTKSDLLSINIPRRSEVRFLGANQP